MKLSIIIPCYNELNNLRKIVDTLNKVSTTLSYDLEVIFADSNSHDGSDHFLMSIANKMYIPILYLSRGYGLAIREGLKQATGDIIAICHADEQTPVTYIFDAIEKYEINDNTIIKGKRLNRNKFDLIFTKGMEFITYMILGSRLNDINAQPKIFTSRFKEKLTDIPDDFTADAYIMHRAYEEGLTVNTIPVVFNKREYGESKSASTLRRKIKTSIDCMKTMWNLTKVSKIPSPLKQLLRFGVVGSLATILNYTIYLLLLRLNINYVVSAYLGYFMGFLLAFYLNAKWTYKGSIITFKTFLKYVISDALTFSLQAITLIILVEILKISKEIANIFGILVSAFFTFIITKFWVFNR